MTTTESDTAVEHEGRIRGLESAQAATEAGAEATQSAAMAELTNTMSALQAGNLAKMVIDGVSLVAGIFLRMAIARRPHAANQVIRRSLHPLTADCVAPVRSTASVEVEHSAGPTRVATWS